VERKYKIIAIVVSLLLVVSFLVKSLVIKNLTKNLALSISNIPSSVINLSFLPVGALVSCNKSLDDNIKLRQENQELRVRLMKLEEAARENKRLDELLGFKQKAEYSLVVARVIAFDASNLRRSLTVNKGRSSGIKIGNPVITIDGAVGKVIEVGKFASRIILINDPDFSMAAKVKRSDVMGVLSGSLSNICMLKYLDLDDDIKPGDEIISTGKNSRFPAGIPIGQVVSIAKEYSGLTLFALVKPKAKLLSTEEVLIITNY